MSTPIKAYRVPRLDFPIDLYLDGNEGAYPPAELVAEVQERGAELLRRYPDRSALERLLAERMGVTPEQVLVTAGADDAIDRVMRAFLAGGREILLPRPTFEMIARYAALAGGQVSEQARPREGFPVDALLEAASERTAVIPLVTPNNPTGAAIPAEAVGTLAEALPGVTILVDQAYAEFDEEAPTTASLELDNAVAVRTLSKAWGLAGQRVGYAIGSPSMIERLRAAGAPYPVGGLALALAEAWLRQGEPVMRAFVERIKLERRRLGATLERLGADPYPSHANFVFARFADAAAVRLGLARRGISVRAFPDTPGLEDALRITWPGDERDFARLERALGEVLADPAAAASDEGETTP